MYISSRLLVSKVLAEPNHLSRRKTNAPHYRIALRCKTTQGPSTFSKHFLLGQNLSSREELQPSLKSRKEGQIEHVQASDFVQDDGADQESGPSLDYFGPIDYDYEPLGALSGTYAVAVSLIFLEEISLNGGSITIL